MIAGDMDKTTMDDYRKLLHDLRAGIRRQYDRSVNRDLSRQQWQGIFKRNVTSVLRQVYQDSLQGLRRIGPELYEEAHAASAAQVLRALDGVVDELIEYALQKHRSSCAMSNFPDEHNPGQAYLFEVIQETGRDWLAFVSQVEGLLPGSSRV
jgi:hypothetical protein